MTLKVIVFKDGKPIDQFSFDAESVSIGRRAESDVPVKDPAISGNHAKIVRVDNDYIIQDLGSTNGLHIDGRKIKQQVLQHDDLITIGEHQLQILILADIPRIKDRDATTVPSQAFLEITAGVKLGQRILLADGLTTVGEPGVQVAAISKRLLGHFIIHVDGGKDRNRVPMVNGEPTGFKSRKLEDGDTIEVAGAVMVYRLG